MSNATPEFLKRHQIVRAGAGAGKTYTLTHKVMEIAEETLKREGRWPRLVVTTFTRKATQELRERLMLLALEEKPHLVDFVNSRSHLMVSTIHGVMDLYLKRYGANICVDPGYTVVAGPQATKVARQVLRQTLLEEVTAESSLLETFPFNKLTTLMRKLDAVWAENPDAKPFSIDDFEVMFKRKALEIARELESAAMNIKEESTKADWLEMAEAYLRLSSLLKTSAGKPGGWSANRERFLSELEVMKTARKNAKNPPVSDMTADEAKDVREKAKKLRDDLYDPVAWKFFAERFARIEGVGRSFSKEFREVKQERGWLEINDLELVAMQCIRSHPETAQAFSEEWDHWLIDEYQDTSPFQVDLLKRLVGEEPVFVVGDPQQSIYLFRGARSEVFSEKENEILEGGGEQKLLTVNRRSKPELLLFLNDFFSRFDPPFRPMEPFLEGEAQVDPSKLVAYVFIAQGAGVSDDEETSDESAEPGGTVAIEGSDNEIDEADEQEMRAVVAHVQNLLSTGTKPEDICVLARTNNTLTLVAEHLTQAHLPTHVHAASGFFDRRETRDALSLLKFLVNPHDAFNTIELLRTPWFRAPDKTLVEIAKRKPSSLWSALVQENSMAVEMESVSRLARWLAEARKIGLTESFRRGLIECGFIDLSHMHDASGRRESNIWKLISRLEAEEMRAGFNPLAFVSGAVIELKLEDGSSEGDAVAAVEPDRINLMTIHASKGLEFKHVILPRMGQKPRLTSNQDFVFDARLGRWASKLPYGENADMTGSLAETMWVEEFRNQELHEHARVLYVALTRAVESVFLSWSSPAKRDSWAEMTRLDLTPGLHKQTSYSYLVHAEPEALQAVQEKGEASVTLRPLWKSPDSGIVANDAAVTSDTAKSFSVTEMIDRKPGLIVKSDSTRDISHTLMLAARGTAVHKLMELLKYPSRDRLNRLITKWFPRQEAKVLEAVEFVRASTEPPLLEIIHNGEVEWGYTMLESGILNSGQVDLWGRTNQGDVWIVDYKTGTPEKRADAFLQMGMYALAIRKSGLVKPEEKIRLAAVYPFAEKIYFEDEPTREQVLGRFGL